MTRISETFGGLKRTGQRAISVAEMNDAVAEAASSQFPRRPSPGLTPFANLAVQWRLTSTEAAALLDVAKDVWERLKMGEDSSGVGEDQMTRISALLGIFEGLHRLFADEMADRWPSLPNEDPLFAGRSPVDSMIEDGVPQILKVRDQIDVLLAK